MADYPFYIGSILRNGHCERFLIANKTLFVAVDNSDYQPIVSVMEFLNLLSDEIVQQAFQSGVDDSSVQDMIALWEEIAKNMYPFSSSTLNYCIGERFYSGN